MYFPLGISHYLAGGLLVGLGVVLIYFYTGIMAGASSFFSTTWSYVSNIDFFRQPRYLDERGWRVLFSISLVLGALVYSVTLGDTFVTSVQWWRLLLGGFLVGVGTRLSRGCTSGHGVCGVADLSKPSISAVVTFLVVGILTALFMQYLGVAP